MRTIAERFWEKVKINEETGCWEWQGNLGVGGYGQLRFEGKTQLAHRIAWRVVYGEIPIGLNVLHKCDNPCCVNYFHLFLGTPQDNARDREQKNRGNQSKGNDAGNSKLTENEVRQIRAIIDTIYNLAKQFGISIQQVRNIKNNKQWKHIQ